MIQVVMYFALGLLTAGLVALLVGRAIWRRAMRLTRARIEAAVPMTSVEINADKDQLRAGFAVSNRRLELDLGRLGEKLAGQVIEVNRKHDESTALKRDKAELTETIAGLGARVKQLTDALGTTEDRLAAATAEISLRDERLAARAAEISQVQAELVAGQQVGEEQRLELVARDTEIGNITDRLVASIAAEAAVVAASNKLTAELAIERARRAEDVKRADGLEANLGVLQIERAERLLELDRKAGELRTLGAELAAEGIRREVLAAELDEAHGRLAAENKRATGLEAGFATLRTERIERQAELGRRASELKALHAEIASEREAREVLSAVVAELKGDRARLRAELTQRGGEVAALSAELVPDVNRFERLQMSANQSEELLAEAKSEIAALAIKLETAAMAGGDNIEKAIAATESRNEALAQRLEVLEAENAAVLAENAELRSVAGPEWESDRQQNQRLREQLNEIASNVVRLAQAAVPGDPGAVGGEDGNGLTPPLPSPGAPATRPSGAPKPVADPGQTATRPAEGGTLAERLRALQHAGARH